jgi:hypothetical protein
MLRGVLFHPFKVVAGVRIALSCPIDIGASWDKRVLAGSVSDESRNRLR